MAVEVLVVATFVANSRGSVELVVEAFGRRVDLEHNSECVSEDRE